MTLELVERAELSRAQGDQVPTADVAAPPRDMRLGVRHMRAIVHELRSFGRPVDRSDECFDPRPGLLRFVKKAALHASVNGMLHGTGAGWTPPW